MPAPNERGFTQAWATVKRNNNERAPLRRTAQRDNEAEILTVRKDIKWCNK